MFKKKKKKPNAWLEMFERQSPIIHPIMEHVIGECGNNLLKKIRLAQRRWVEVETTKNNLLKKNLLKKIRLAQRRWVEVETTKKIEK